MLSSCQAKTSSQASKLRQFETMTNLLTRVKCRATSVAKNVKTSLVTCYKAQWQCFPVSFPLLLLLPISTQGLQEAPEDGDEGLDIDYDDENDDDYGDVDGGDDDGCHLKGWVCVGKHSESCFTVPWGLLQVDDHLHQHHDDDDLLCQLDDQIL